MKKDVTVFLRYGVTFHDVPGRSPRDCALTAMHRAQELIDCDVLMASRDDLRRLSSLQLEDVIYANASDVSSAMVDENEFGSAGGARWFDSQGQEEVPQ